MRSYRRPSTHCRTSANTRSAGLRSVGRPPLPPPSPCQKPHGPIPRPCPLPRSEYLLNRLTADPSPLSPASIAPLAAAPTAPAISWLSEYLPPACKAGKTPLLDGFKLSSMAVLCLLGSGWDIRIRLTGNGIRQTSLAPPPRYNMKKPPESPEMKTSLFSPLPHNPKQLLPKILKRLIHALGIKFLSNIRPVLCPA